jgi:hypothetical protein
MDFSTMSDIKACTAEPVHDSRVTGLWPGRTSIQFPSGQVTFLIYKPGCGSHQVPFQWVPGFFSRA